MDEISNQSKNVVDKIKKMLFNIDLSLAYADAQIQANNAKMELYSNDKRKSAQKRFISAKIDKERYEQYINSAKNLKDELIDHLNIILDKYKPNYKIVFISYFIENKTYNEISAETHYSMDAIKVIIKKLKSDLIDIFVP